MWSAVLKNETWTKFLIFWYFCVLIEDDLKSSLNPLSFCFNFSCSIYDTMYNYFNYLEILFFLQKSWLIVQFSKDKYNLFNLLHYCLWIFVFLMVNFNLFYFWRMNINYYIPKGWIWFIAFLKWVFAKNEGGYRFHPIKNRFWSLLILLLSVVSIRRKLLKTSHTEERRVHTNSERCNIQLGS